MSDLIEIKGKWADVKNFRFLTRIMCKPSYSECAHLTHVCIEDGYGLTTDGTRIHRCNLVGDYENGLYRTFKINQSCFYIHKSPILTIEKNFPKYKDIITPNAKCRVIKSQPINKLYIINAVSKIIRALPEESAINFEFIKDLNDDFDIYIPTKETEPIIFKNGNYLAAIMTVKLMD